MSEAGASTPSGRSQRRKTLSYKARQNQETQHYLKSLQLDEDSSDEVYAGNIQFLLENIRINRCRYIRISIISFCK